MVMALVRQRERRDGRQADSSADDEHPAAPADDDKVDATDVLVSLREADLAALVVAEPYQEIVGQALDGLDAGACRVGRVNLIRWDDGRSIGDWIEDEVALAALLDAGLGLPRVSS